ncbi:hypothetical protein [Micromonospora mirobrigensis]|uniref:Uncharacterized protein n=1 Tax=Micromonospora mirobrigensis TaxID=262898 RepID=A0A1C4TWN0_9ACTN|nr:hypothetical protein [Micromonospora mirobrigensis]SCE63842.1 hypothetical protein GA0070564_1018 [Micromonospora mirobrigensis]
MSDPTPPTGGHRARVDLPDWMRNPEPPRRTPGRRISELVDSVPALHEARRRIWRWRDRTRYSERHPVISAVVSFFVVALTATLLITGTLYLFHQITHHEL